MEKSRNLFNVFPKKRKNGQVYYYYYVYDTNGKRKQYSTGKLTEAEAYKECMRLAKLNQLNRRSSLAFETYCQDWFVYDRCPYIQAKLLHGFTYSRSYAENQRAQLERHTIPFFKDKTIDSITSNDIEGFIVYLKDKGLSNISINHNLKLLNVILNYALKRNEISYNPMKQVVMLKPDSLEKGRFTKEEARKLFTEPDSLDHVWAGNQNDWLMNLTAYKTGCRLGELQALRKDDIKDGYILVQHGFDRKYGMKSTKTNRTREVPINENLCALLYRHIADRSGEFVFGQNDGNRPIRHDEVYKAFWAAAGRIGLSRDALKERRITFHSYRHGFSTRMLAEGVAEPLVRAMTGHATQRMLDHYTHIGLEELRQVGNL
jgi:integrase